MNIEGMPIEGHAVRACDANIAHVPRMIFQCRDNEIVVACLHSQCRTHACAMLYPMHALAIADLLQLTRFPTHQELLKAGKLVEIKDGMDVLFVSHQWLSMQHPDPESNQLRCLLRVLSRLADGKLDVENDYKQQVMFHDRGLKSKNGGKRR
jgi:hypothetical protein